MKKVIALCLLNLCFLLANAQLRFANIFSDHMVLQRNAPVNIWGWAKQGEKITIAFNGQKINTKAGKNGKWLVSFSAVNAGGPFKISLSGKDKTIELTDVLVGDVWLCSGQSNMEWALSNSKDAAAAIASTSNNNIRHIKVERTVSISPIEDIQKTQWQVASPQTAAGFTAVGYYFAKSIQSELNIPVGLINSSWGGTMVETWISKTGLQKNAEFINIANEIPSSLEKFEKQQADKLQKDIAGFQQIVQGESSKGWEKPDFDDQSWSSLTVPQQWESQGLPTFDGIVWYRTGFVLNDEQVKSDMILNLGTIDDIDITYVNGIEVGKTNAWDVNRSYTIPLSLLKPGKNTIAVKVTDGGGGGGFYGESANVFLQAGTTKIPLSGKWKARIETVASAKTVINPNSMPTLLYNAMIAPLLQYNFKGAIWYQGESNASRAYQYQQSFPLLINDWRAKFNKPSLPFYFVQLATFNANNQNDTKGSVWAELRDAQLQALHLPHTGMAVTTDIGDPKDIHPRNKKDVGERLALHALKNEYGKNIVASGPLFKSYAVEGNKIVLKFDNVGSGLMATNNKYGYLNGFMIAGADEQFKWAKAAIKNNEVIVWNESVANPVAVRYGWMDDATEINLYNKEGLPASPFRTDKWKWITQDVKYSIGQ